MRFLQTGGALTNFFPNWRKQEMLWLLGATVAAMIFFPETPTAKLLNRILIEEPARKLGAHMSARVRSRSCRKRPASTPDRDDATAEPDLVFA
jgi:hypothetical protein